MAAGEVQRRERLLDGHRTSACDGDVSRCRAKTEQSKGHFPSIQHMSLRAALGPAAYGLRLHSQDIQ